MSNKKEIRRLEKRIKLLRKEDGYKDQGIFSMIWESMGSCGPSDSEFDIFDEIEIENESINKRKGDIL